MSVDAESSEVAGVFDHVVVGAGSAGCVLANRLTAAGRSVLLLEAGGWDRDPLIHLPIGIGKIFPERRHDWNYVMEPSAAVAGRGIECARGRVVGGSSSINVMAHVRGHRGDYERWAASGLRGWGPDDVLPYFRRCETWEGGADDFRGGDGPLRVQRSRYRDPILGSLVEAGRQAGFATTADYNGAEQCGFSITQQTIHRGRRQSAAVAYLRPALRRRHLRVETRASAEKVVFDGARAAGVRYRRDGRSWLAAARREVILSLGAIDSPKLLMLSGVGDPERLARHGIATVVASPGVGRNLQDHLSVMVRHRRLDVGTFQPAMRYDRLALSMLGSLAGFPAGFAGDLPVAAMAFLRTRPDLATPDVQLIFMAAPFPAHPHLRPFRHPVPNGYGCRVALLHPVSRGTVRLASADPLDAPSIDGGFLQDPADLAVLLDGLALTRRVLSRPEMAAHDGGEHSPGPEASTDAALRELVRGTAVTVHHPASTCRMGAVGDPERVVDEELRVCGAEALRVVDASVMPDLPSGNINAVVLMIAEKAADAILARRDRPAACANAGAHV